MLNDVPDCYTSKLLTLLHNNCINLSLSEHSLCFLLLLNLHFISTYDMKYLHLNKSVHCLGKSVRRKLLVNFKSYVCHLPPFDFLAIQSKLRKVKEMLLFKHPNDWLNCTPLRVFALLPYLIDILDTFQLDNLNKSFACHIIPSSSIILQHY